MVVVNCIIKNKMVNEIFEFLTSLEDLGSEILIRGTRYTNNTVSRNIPMLRSEKLTFLDMINIGCRVNIEPAKIFVIEEKICLS